MAFIAQWLQVLTVSPNYATEVCQNPQLGVELDDALRCVQHALTCPVKPACAGSVRPACDALQPL